MEELGRIFQRKAAKSTGEKEKVVDKLYRQTPVAPRDSSVTLLHTVNR